MSFFTRTLFSCLVGVLTILAASPLDADAAPPSKRLTLKAVGMQVRSADPAWTVRTERVDGRPARDVLTHTASTLTITLTPLTDDCDAALGAYVAKHPKRARWSWGSLAAPKGPRGWHPASVSFRAMNAGEPGGVYCFPAREGANGMMAAVHASGEWQLRGEWVLEDLVEPGISITTPTEPRPRPPRPEPEPAAVRAELEALVSSVAALSERDPSTAWVDRLEHLYDALPFSPVAGISAEDLRRYRETLQDAASRFFRHTDIHVASGRVWFVWYHNGLRLGARSAGDTLTWPIVRVFAGAIDTDGDRVLTELGLTAAQLEGIDTNGDGRLDIDEAVDAVEQGKLALTLDANAAGSALLVLDRDGDGYIGIHELDLPYRLMRAADEMAERGLKVNPDAKFEMEVGAVAHDGRVAIIELAAMFGYGMLRVGRTLELSAPPRESAPAR